MITKGTYGWQYLFAEVDLKDPNFSDTVQHLQCMLKTFPEIFPDHDYEGLRDRLTAAL